MNEFGNMAWHKRALGLLAYLAIWTIPGLISASQLMLSYSLRGDDPPLSIVLGLSLPGWYLWAALAPLVYWAALRFPIELGSLRRSLPLHFLFNAVLAVAWVALIIAIRDIFTLPGARALAPVMVGAGSTNLLTYWTVVLIAHAFRYRAEREAKTRNEIELSAQLSEARLSALKAQLNPHFLFNTLHAISAFIRTEPAKAETMLADLGDLLRRVLERSDDQLVPLASEVEFVDGYLQIQQTRLGDRLSVRRAVEDGLAGVDVPSMLLQPLVENAVEHAIAKRRRGGTLSLSISTRGDQLQIVISDDGPGISEAALDPAYWRIGLRNTRDRLIQLFADEQEFSVRTNAEGGVTVVVRIPLSRQATGVAS